MKGTHYLGSALAAPEYEPHYRYGMKRNTFISSVQIER